MPGPSSLVLLVLAGAAVHDEQRDEDAGQRQGVPGRRQEVSVLFLRTNHPRRLSLAHEIVAEPERINRPGRSAWKRYHATHSLIRVES
jgi:hypothetical protein